MVQIIKCTFLYLLSSLTITLSLSLSLSLVSISLSTFPSNDDYDLHSQTQVMYSFCILHLPAHLTGSASDRCILQVHVSVI